MPFGGKQVVSGIATRLYSEAVVSFRMYTTLYVLTSGCNIAMGMFLPWGSA
ncbi:hypothetical protein BN11_230016 [Nostocoides australiense Ben110]|uniref:Uncharacterized protein n=1 Tax=Nostocoides australiense Ben110 TaxID=1193182 RepID=W6JWP5_9MICO|nr:hypothetical protein BN11_230016 [Tetrasphaera australiensis Ben110]